MNISVTFLLQRRARYFRALAPALSAAFASPALAISAYPRSHHISCTVSWASNCLDSAKYLALVGVIPLRFALPPEPATERPVVLVPVLPVKVPITETRDPPPVTAALPESHPMEIAKVETAPAGPVEKPVSILPDDTPRDVKAEDILPYFQMPKNSAPSSGVALPFTPASPTLPASSATYELK